jgi:hypothetical protein
MLLIVSNQGGDTLNVNTTEINGIDSLQFSIFSGHAPFSIPPGGNPDTIQIQFSPTSIGTKTANMQIISNDSDENRIDISLNGTGVVPDIAIDPDTLNFDSVFVLIDTTLSVSVTNQGSGNLIVNTTNIIGIDSAQFSITSGQAPFTILPGGNPHIIEIQLIPISYGVINADLRIVSNDPNKNPIDIHLIAVGVASDISINPDSLNFGNVLILQDSLMSISVSNTGNSTLDVDSTQIVGADSNQFSLITGQGSFTVPPDSSHIIEVKFSPTSVGTKMADLRITSNDPDETPLDVPLMGTGIQPGAPEIVVNPDSLSFGNVLVSADSIRSVLVSNFGNEDLQVASTEILGMDSIQFSIISGQAPFTVPAGGDPDTIQIKFSPTSAGFKIASLQITSNDPDENPFDVPLNGSGFEVPDISVNPDSLNFGNVLILQDSLMSISVSNTGNSILNVGSTKIVGADSAQFFIISGQAPFNIPPGGNPNIIEIEFSPTTGGEKQAYLRFFSNDPDENPIDVPLIGIGIQPGAPDIVVNPDSFGFGNVLVSDDSIQSVLVSNFGSEELQVTSTEILGTDSLQFSIISGQAPFTIPAGGDPDIIQIKFSPTSLGSKIATLQIISNDPDENPLDLPLTGKGVVPAFPDIAVIPDSLDYGYVIVSQDSIIAVSVSNLGNADLTVNSTEITGNDSSDFSFISGNGSFIIPVGGNARALEIEFSPVSPGEKRAELKVRSNDPYDDPLIVPLVGWGVSPNTPRIVTTPKSLDFDTLFIDESLQLSISVKNDGGAELVVNQTSIEGPDADNFFISSGGGSFTIPSGGPEHNLGINFNPISAGEKNANLRITSNDAMNNLLDIPLRGVGKVDQTPAQIIIESETNNFTSNTSFNFQVMIVNNETSVKSASLFVRKGGGSNYSNLQLSNTDQNHWTTTIPAGFVTERGVEYYMEVKHGGNTTYFPTSGGQTPQVVLVSVPTMAFPFSTLSSTYQKISLPINAGNQTLKDLLEDNLGSYDNTEYRVFDWNQTENKYVELENLNSTLPPGKAIWLITKESKSLDIANAQSVNTGNEYSISLKEGWNMIGDPFAFPVSWSDIDASAIQGGALHFYDGSGWKTATKLEPFRGYAVYSNSATVLNVPPHETEVVRKLQLYSQLDESDWQIQLEAEKSNYKDEYNFAGIRNSAKEELDEFDIPEPPPIGQYISLSFNHTGRHQKFGNLTCNYKNPGENGYLFDFLVKSNFDGITSIFCEAQNLPEFFDWAIVSAETGVKYPKKEFKINNNAQNFTLIVGSNGFLEFKLLDFREIPRHFDLLQNYPNPFNPSTTIAYQLPVSSRIRLEVFNILGQRIVTLIDESQLPGYYNLIWNISEAGVGVASGVYILRMSASGEEGRMFSNSIKMLLVK